MDVGIGMTLDRAEKFADELKNKVLEAKTGTGYLDFTEYAIDNNAGGEVTLSINNDDMERPEMADKIIVDVDD